MMIMTPKPQKSEDAAIMEFLEAVKGNSFQFIEYNAYSGFRANLEQAAINLFEAARKSTLSEISELKDRLHKTEMDRNKLAKMIVTERNEVKQQLIEKDKLLKEKNLRVFFSKEGDDSFKAVLKELEEKDKELEETTQMLDNAILERTFLQTENKELRDGVGKLKAGITAFYGRGFDDRRLQKFINQIFPSCAEQPKK